MHAIIMKLLISKEAKCKTFHRPFKEGAHHQGLPKVTKIGSILVFMVPKVLRILPEENGNHLTSHKPWNIQQ